MKCYNHHDRDAFGICKSCGKALCLECMSSESKNVICTNDLKCLYKDRQTEKMYINAEKVYSKTNVNRSIWIAIALILVAIPFLLLSVFNKDVVYLTFTILFISCGIVLLKRAKEVQN